MRIPTVEIVDPDTGRRKIVNADDPRARPAPLTRDDIARMPKGDVAELLTMHGVDPDPKAKVADLRDLASRVIFADF